MLVALQRVLRASEIPIEAAYHKLGYMYAYVDAHATTDDASHTVGYRMQAVPGDVYRLHTLQVQGLPPQADALFRLAWKMPPGDPYNADYAAEFLHDHSALRGLQGYAGTFQAAADAATHAVDLTVQFTQITGR